MASNKPYAEGKARITLPSAGVPADYPAGSRASASAIEGIMRKAGVAVATGALVLTLCPVSSFAAESGSTSSSSSSSSATSSTLQQADDSSAASASEGTPPALPDGQAPGGDVTGAPGDGGQPGGGGGGADTMSFDYSGSYSGATTADGSEESSDGETISASETDQNAALAQNGGTLTLTNDTLTKSGDDSNGDNCNFYGLNSIGLAVGDSSRINISDCSLTASSEGSNALFATDSGTIYANNDTIETSAGNSRGLDATYGGTIIANQMDITTQGDHCATVATDRGGGDISLTNSTLSTAGSGSPLLYSTGDIQVSGVTGTATGSQIAGMEGLNTILINNSTLSSTQTDKTASDPIADGIIIYQSTSGDAESKTGDAATFQAADSTLKSAIESGSMFYFTNTTANVTLSNTKLDFDSSKANLIQAEGNDSNGWGTAGQNGATVNFTGIGEDMDGNVVADTISSVDLYLTEGSTWTGSASIEENENGSTSEAPISVNVDGSSSWVVTGDSTVSNLTVADGGSVVDENGKTVTIKQGDEIVVQGDSGYTVTVNGSYSTDYDGSNAGTLQADLIDRSEFDDQYSTSTAFSMGDANTTQQASDSSSASSDGEGSASESTDADSGSWWDSVVSWFKGLFGAV